MQHFLSFPAYHGYPDTSCKIFLKAIYQLASQHMPAYTFGLERLYLDTVDNEIMQRLALFTSASSFYSPALKMR